MILAFQDCSVFTGVNDTELYSSMSTRFRIDVYQLVATKNVRFPYGNRTSYPHSTMGIAGYPI